MRVVRVVAGTRCARRKLRGVPLHLRLLGQIIVKVILVRLLYIAGGLAALGGAARPRGLAIPNGD